MNSFFVHLQDMLVAFQNRIQEHFLLNDMHQNEMNQINESINADQINSQHHQVLNDHMQYHQQIQHHEIHHNDHMDHMNHM